MVRKCVGGHLVAEGQTSWNIPTLPNDRGAAECRRSGGEVVEDDTSSCGASTSSVGQMTGSSSSALSLTSAVLDPVRRTRDAFSGSHLVRSLALVNDSGELIKVVLSNPPIASRIAEGVGFLSTICTAVLAGKSGEPPLTLKYDQELHEWVAGLAKDVQSHLSSQELREALDQAVGVLDTYVGRTFGDVAGDLAKDGRGFAA